MQMKKTLRPVAKKLSPEELRARRELRIKREARKAKRWATKRLTPEELRPGQIVGFRRQNVRILDRFDDQTFLVTPGFVFTVHKRDLTKRTGR